MGRFERRFEAFLNEVWKNKRSINSSSKVYDIYNGSNDEPVGAFSGNQRKEIYTFCKALFDLAGRHDFKVHPQKASRAGLNDLDSRELARIKTDFNVARKWWDRPFYHLQQRGLPQNTSWIRKRIYMNPKDKHLLGVVGEVVKFYEDASLRPFYAKVAVPKGARNDAIVVFMSKGEHVKNMLPELVRNCRGFEFNASLPKGVHVVKPGIGTADNPEQEPTAVALGVGTGAVASFGMAYSNLLFEQVRAANSREEFMRRVGDGMEALGVSPKRPDQIANISESARRAAQLALVRKQVGKKAPSSSAARRGKK
jgi:hypothetical protein